MHAIFLLFLIIYTKGQEVNNCESIFYISGITEQKYSSSEIESRCNKDTPCLPLCGVKYLSQNPTPESPYSLLKTESFPDPLWDFDYFNITLYKEVAGELVKSDKKLKNFTIVHHYKNESCWNQGLLISEDRYYFVEDGTIRMEKVNAYDRWSIYGSVHMFCLSINYLMGEDNVTILQAAMTLHEPFDETYNEIDDENLVNLKNNLKISCYIISSIFMLLVLAVYVVLPELRDLHGIILMSYVFSLTLTFILQTIYFNNQDYLIEFWEARTQFNIVRYYTNITAFMWMNVISFHIWWTIRNKCERRQSYKHSSGLTPQEKKKYMWYFLYATGVPAVLVTFAAIVDKSENIRKYHPGFIRPFLEHFFEPLPEYQLYFYTPLIILTVVNLIFFTVSIYLIWRTEQRRINLACRSNKNNKIRLWLYIKIFLIMGVVWIFEVIEGVSTLPEWLNMILFTYNLSTGFFIFIVFVCKRSIIRKLRKRFAVLPQAEPVSGVFTTSARSGFSEEEV